MEFKIKPIKGCENMTNDNEPDKRKKALKKCATVIEELLRRNGVNAKIGKITGRNSYPCVPLGSDIAEMFLLIKVLDLVCEFGFELTGYMKVMYDERDMKGDIRESFGWDERIRKVFLTLDTTISDLYMQIFKCYENIFRKKEIDLAELIEFVAPKAYEIDKKVRELYNKTKNVLKHDERLRELPIIKELLKDKGELEFRDWMISDWDIRGWILWIDDGLKYISKIKLANYKGKYTTQELPWFDFSEGKITQETFYIYEEIEKVSYPFETETTGRDDREEPKTFTFKDFKKQIDRLDKFGIYLDEEKLKKFYAGINSGNKFVILAGATGTGKTLLSILFPAARYNILGQLIEKSQDEDTLKEKIQSELKDYICLIRVAPNWTSPKDVIGYFNPINNQFVKGPLYEFLLRANNEKEKDFFLILDEMNLSHPEHYLSDILSAMETQGEIYIHNSDEIKDKIEKKISYPSNLHIIGTINIDETTKELSPRLKSRAFVIELRANFDNYIEKCTDENEQEIAKILRVIDHHLSKIELGVGYRDIKHISEYVKNGGKIDEALIQKIIPRIHTTNDKFNNVIKELIEELNNNFNTQTQEFCARLRGLEEKFKSQGFV